MSLTNMEKSRIMALADGIFAVAMTLLVLDLKLPEGVKLATDAEVWNQLVDLKDRFLIYALSFIVLGTYWIGHHFQFHLVRRVDRALLWLNLLFLLFITLLPFSTNLLSDRSELHVPVVVYGMNLLLPSLVLLWHLRYLMKHPEIAHEGFASSRFAGVSRRTALVALFRRCPSRFPFSNRDLRCLPMCCCLQCTSCLAGATVTE